MSITYPQYNLTLFPENVDDFPNLQDISASDVPIFNQYKNYINNSDIASAQQLLEDNPSLKNKIFSATNLNRISQGVMAVEKFFKENVDDFIITKQNEMTSYVDTKEAGLTLTVDNFNTAVENKETAFNTTLQQFDNKGAFSTLTNYQKWNTVSFNYQTYMSLQNNNLNHTPAGVTDAWWQISALRGEKGEKGDSGSNGLNLIYRGTYDAFRTYEIADATNWGGSIYYVYATPPMGTSPSDQNYWSIFMQRSPIQVSATPPSNPSIDDVYINSATLSFYRYNGSAWVALRTDTITDGTYTFTASDINDMQTDITTASNDITDLSGYITTNTNNISTLNGTGEIVEKANKTALDTTNSNLSTTNSNLATANSLITELKQYTTLKSNKDANGIYTTYQRNRFDTTLLMQSVVSGGESPLYTTRTETWYAPDGTTVLSTKVYTITYDSDGIPISEI